MPGTTPPARKQLESTVLVAHGPSAPVLRTCSSSPRSTALSANHRTAPRPRIEWPSARLVRATGEHEWPQHALRVQATQQRDRGASRPAPGDPRQRRPRCGVCSTGLAEPDPMVAAIVQVHLRCPTMGNLFVRPPLTRFLSCIPHSHGLGGPTLSNRTTGGGIAGNRELRSVRRASGERPGRCGRKLQHGRQHAKELGRRYPNEHTCTAPIAGGEEKRQGVRLRLPLTWQPPRHNTRHKKLRHNRHQLYISAPLPRHPRLRRHSARKEYLDQDAENGGYNRRLAEIFRGV